MKTGVSYWTTGLAFAATLVGARSFGLARAESPVTVFESAAARGRVTELRARFVLHATRLVTPSLGTEPTAPLPVLGASVASRFDLHDNLLRGLIPEGARRAVERRASVALPVHADASVRLEDDTSHVGVSFALRGASDATVTTAGGFALYAGALAGSDVLHRVHAEGTEDYVVFEDRPASEEIAYDVDVSRVAGLRLVSNTLEFLDAGGAPRLRIAPPYVVDAKGVRSDAVIALEGCAFDRSPRAPWGRPVTSPGASHCGVRVPWKAALYPAMVDPSWTATGSMVTARNSHTATLLGSGQVLFVGGYGGSGAVATAELYDPTSGTFAATGSPATARWMHTATALATGPNAGQVLIAGGSITYVNGVFTATASAELYDPQAGTFAATGSMTTPRHIHTATRLDSGKVLLAGSWGDGSPTGFLSSAELYDPQAGTFAATGSMTTPRHSQTATLLDSGKVLMAGGDDNGLSSAELYDPQAETFAATGSMATRRYWHKATLLGSGEVLVTGGTTVALADGVDADPTSTAELYDPQAGTFVAMGAMATPRFAHSATLLGSGEVLVAGGTMAVPTPDGETATETSGAESYDPTAKTFRATDSMRMRRVFHTATLLGSGQVLIAGGYFLSQLPSAELFRTASGDGGVDAGASNAEIRTVASPGGGCGCRTAHGGGAPGTGLLPMSAAVLAAALWRGRRRTRRLGTIWALLSGVIWLTACGSDHASPTGRASPDGGNGPGDAGGGSLPAPKPEFIPKPSGTCPTIADGMLTFSPAGIPPRNVHLYVPRKVARPAPLVFYWHGTGSPAEEAEVALSIPDVNAAGWIVAAPRRDPAAPGGGWFLSTPGADRDDDLRVADEVLGCINEQIGLDTRHVHSIGMGAGGLQTTQMSWRRDGYIASSVSYSGGQVGSTPPEQDPDNKYAAMIFHGGITDGNSAYLSEAWFTELESAGHFVFACDHSRGTPNHPAAPGNLIPMDAVGSAFRFMKAHPWHSVPDPYAGGLPADFPEYCSLQAPPRFDLTTESGVVRGRLDGKTRAFLGIPYAAPPTGANRFRAPQPVTPWTSPRDATAPSQVCPQIAPGFGGTDSRSNEDCLTLNVWVPDPPPASPVPVMVWIHGGAFVFGSGAETYYDGSKLAEAGNVVVVTINYRLGALGFLALPALTAESTGHPTSGNYGFEDQQAALTWVKNNSAAFGGDPGNVTLFGESAGGYSVCAHLVAPGSRGLFHRAISQSGLCSGLVGRLRDDAYPIGEALARAVGCSDASKVLECLRGKTADELVHALDGAGSSLPGGTFLQGPPPAWTANGGADAGVEPNRTLWWSPVVDGTTIPVNVADVGASFAKVPLLLGTNENEGALFTNPFLFGGLPVSNEAEYQAALARTFGGRTAEVQAQYPSSGFASANDAVNALATDAFFVCPARRLARGAAAAGVSVYLYAFAHVPEQPLLPGLGSFHGSETSYVFGFDSPMASTQPDEQPLLAVLQGYWTRFAHAGDPNGAAAPVWPEYTAAGDQDLKLDLPTPTAEAGHKKAKCDFWDSMR